ncbi:hypothetical protein [Salinispora mooreana]|uniref:hypothetical protein n=1 Tax=Salinispora mooreana TaxID=999545 RepID=UPI00037B07EC|nr:hypothetical protein [Salinispora mooreana]
MPDNEMAEIHQRATAAVTAMIQAAGEVAQVLIEARIMQLQRAARASDEQARRIRAQTRAAQQADAAVWRPAMRTGWWRTAGTEDIARVWRAASTWHHVDPRAQQARQMVVDQLAKRAGRVGPETHKPAAEPDGIEALSDAVDRAVSEDTEQSQRLPMSAEAVSDRHERMAAEVHKAWPGQRADTVIGCEAWGALAYTLDQAQHTGHDVQQLLRGVSRFVDRAQRPAAYACRVVQDQLDETVDLGTVRMQSRHGTEPAAVAASAFPQSTISAVTEVASASEEQQPTVRPATSSVSMAAPGR